MTAMGTHVLVLGGSGFIGSHLVPALLRYGFSVRVLSRTRLNNDNLLLNDIDYHYTDYQDSVKLSKALDGIDIVIHLISTTVPGTGNLNPIADIRDNMIPTVNLLEQMRASGIKKIVYISSGGTIYGNAKKIPTPEYCETEPISSYGIVKLSIEKYINMFDTIYGMEKLIIRPANPYGPFQKNIGIQGVIPTFFYHIMNNNKIKIWGDGSSIRDFLYISDLINFLIKAIKKNITGIYNVGSGIGVSLNHVIDLIENISGIKADVEYCPHRKFDVKDVILDISKAKKDLDWNPIISLQDGCQMYWEWIKKEKF